MALSGCKPCHVTGLQSPIELLRLCSNQLIKLSEETNDVLLLTVLKKIGARRATLAVEKLIKDGHLSKEVNEYEVEEILAKKYSYQADCDLFLVKWKHWPEKFNTWEPLRNLANCHEALARFTAALQESPTASNKRQRRPQVKRESDSENEFDSDEQRQIIDVYTKLRKRDTRIEPGAFIHLSGIVEKPGVVKPQLKRRPSAWATKKRTRVYQEHKMSLAEALHAWEARFNSVYPSSKPVIVENDVDLEAPPENFKFINDYIHMDGLTVQSEPVMGCCCEDKCTASKKTCCPHNSDADFAYTPGKRVRLIPGSAIYECNSLCSCGPECWNRVVQLGSQVDLVIFKTSSGCGWGVKARKKIIKGSFIMEYLGEVITNEEAEKRGKIYDVEGLTYLFDLDFHDDDCPFTIDARNYGNISHFVNHSCDPNMSVYGVWINNLDIRLPRIALFANRDVRAGEELTFDYKMTGDTSQEPAVGGSLTPVKLSPFARRSSTGQRVANEMTKFRLELDLENSSSPSSPTNLTGTGDIDVLEEKSFPSQDESSDSIESATSSSSDLAALTDKFSCKDYRIACHCGAKNCRKFLF